MIFSILVFRLLNDNYIFKKQSNKRDFLRQHKNCELLIYLHIFRNFYYLFKSLSNLKKKI